MNPYTHERRTKIQKDIPRMNQKPSLEISTNVNELQHLRRTLERLEGLGASRSQTIDSLKRVVLQRIAELEVPIDEILLVQATPMYESNLRRTTL